MEARESMMLEDQRIVAGRGELARHREPDNSRSHHYRALSSLAPHV